MGFRWQLFTQNVVEAWNILPCDMVDAVMLATFKENLDRHTNRQGIEGYRSCVGRCAASIGIMASMEIMGQRAWFCAVLFNIICILSKTRKGVQADQKDIG